VTSGVVLGQLGDVAAAKLASFLREHVVKEKVFLERLDREKKENGCFKTDTLKKLYWLAAILRAAPPKEANPRCPEGQKMMKEVSELRKEADSGAATGTVLEARLRLDDEYFVCCCCCFDDDGAVGRH